MKVYPTESLRNVALVAHGGAGKTSLTEAMLFQAGATKRLGRVEEGNTVTDFHPEEIKRKVSINTSLAFCEWAGHKINLLDTPGYADFFGDVVAALRVADGLVVVISAVAGVEVQTEIIWEQADKFSLPRLAFINKMDRENANFQRALESMKKLLSGNIVPVELPIGAAETFSGIIDLLEFKAYSYQNGQRKEIPIPEEYRAEAESFRELLVEAAAEGDDELLMKYLEGGKLAPEEIRQGLKQAVATSKVIPVLCGSALKNMGVEELLHYLVDFLPSPADRIGKPGVELEKEPLATLIFKTLADPYVGKISLFKVYSGNLRPDITVYNANKETEEKISGLFTLQGKTQIPVTELKPGDIGAVTKLTVSGTGDTLTTKTNPKQLPGINFPEPTLPVAIRPKSKGDEDKLSNALARLLEEDPTLRLSKNTETRETILTGMGELHLDITLERLHSKFGVEVEMSTPKVPYRETIRASVTRVEGKYKKQTGGRGQYGHVFIDMSPLPDKEFEFTETIFGGAVPRQYIPAVEKGIREAMQEGILAGYPVTNIKVNLADGSYHTVDSSELAFKIAAGMAFRKAMEQAKPVLLEPIMNVEITVPEQFMGDIIGDLNGRRGRILGMEAEGKNQIIRAQVPLAEMYRYAIDLKSLTQGRGHFRMEFAQYEEVPANLAEKIIQEARQAKQE
ncbi:translation elongation factor 2 (EF-2/EF-G) [Thermanaeromonas toyohensis ToBE]|uniref:Elongation factor G n=1 Tax=Thermanaeromonas toyohensis ToBE TaxID=698762 RepID=A0A1W1VYF3_9FIRM|nr:elongation factor G [Thermanaeromonas toyohensis]SMB97884.1 translation elongation factor 2 (EF-2/EF-G) [Thermanaeromonas toyohensis ToBE]